MAIHASESWRLRWHDAWSKDRPLRKVWTNTSIAMVQEYWFDNEEIEVRRITSTSMLLVAHFPDCTRTSWWWWTRNKEV